MTAQGITPPTQQASTPAPPSAGIGRSLLGDLAAAAEAERPFARAYVVTLRGSEAERVHYDDDAPEKLFLRAPVRAWGKAFLRFADDSLVDPLEVAEIRLATSEEAADIAAEAEDGGDEEDAAPGEHVFDAIEDLKRALAAVTLDRRPAIFPPAPPAPVVAPIATAITPPRAVTESSALPLPPPPEVHL